MDKAILDMATRSWSPSIRNLLVQLLNEANSEVRDAHEIAEGKAMKNKTSASRDGGFPEIPIDAKFDESQRLSTTVKDDYDLGPGFEASSDVDRSKGPAPAGDAQTTGNAQYAAEVASQERSCRRTREKLERLIDEPNYRNTYRKDGFKRKRTTDLSESSSSEDTPKDDSDFYEGKSEHSNSQSGTDYSSDFELAGSKVNDATRQELIQDEVGEIMLHNRTQKQMREAFKRMSRKEQENFDQDTLVLRQLLSLSPDRVYTLNDLDDPDVHHRALRLLHRARFGQSKEYSRISPHINYDMLHPKVVSGIKKKLRIQEDEMAYLLQVGTHGKAAKGCVSIISIRSTLTDILQSI